MAKNKKLFSDFPPVSNEEWESVIHKDLKGADYDRKLVWKTNEGFQVKPYYQSESLKDVEYLDNLPGEFPFTSGNKITSTSWFIRQDIIVDDIKKANKKALEILMKGVTSLGFILDTKFEPTIEEIEQLCENIYADAVELNFICFHNSFKIVQHVEKLVKKYNRDLDKICGSVDFDPIGQYTLTGKFPESSEASFGNAKRMIETAGHLPNFKVITINGKYFHNSGASIVEELAFSLSQGVNYLTQLTERGLSINEIAPRILFQFAVGSNYFMEIAKIRAARLLWAQIVHAYGPCCDSKTKMYIHSTTSDWNKTVYDPHVNMLRTTTESMSAIIGGADSLTVNPFNSNFDNPAEFSERIARNQQLLLKEESYLDKVTDPAAGSYYIENLTNLMAEEAWKLFLEVQEKGGFLEAFKSGFVQERIKTTSQKLDLDIATRKEVLLGTNQYPNPTEYKEEELNDHVFQSFNCTAENADVETLKPYRGAQAFETLRYQTDEYSKSNKRPAVFMLTLGNLAMRRARSQFAGNFFSCAGYEIIDNNGFGTVEEAAKACIDAKAEIAVICSSDEEYVDIAPKLLDLLNGKAIVVLAGYPKDLVAELQIKGLRHFIYMRSNVLEILKEFQNELNII